MTTVLRDRMVAVTPVPLLGAGGQITEASVPRGYKLV